MTFEIEVLVVDSNSQAIETLTAADFVLGPVKRFQILA
jgi:hypothetical protein